MQSISIAELLLVIYVIIDDWYLYGGQIINNITRHLLKFQHLFQRIYLDLEGYRIFV